MDQHGILDWYVEVATPTVARSYLTVLIDLGSPHNGREYNYMLEHLRHYGNTNGRLGGVPSKEYSLKHLLP